MLEGSVFVCKLPALPEDLTGSAAACFARAYVDMNTTWRGTGVTLFVAAS